MACPVLSACTNVIGKELWSKSDTALPLYDDMASSWADLEDQIRAEEPEETTKRLRAFYAFEYVYYIIVPTSSYPKDRLDLNALFAKKRARNMSAVDDVTDLCEKALRELTIRRGTMRMSTSDEDMRKAQFSFLADSLEQTEKRVSVCNELATSMKGIVNNHDPPFKKVGSLFAKALLVSSIPIDTHMQIFNTMQTISLSNPVRPWNRSIIFLV